MNNHLAMNICEAIMPVKDDCVNVTITTDSNKVYNNVKILDFDTRGAYFGNDECDSYVYYDEIIEINVKNIPE